MLWACCDIEAEWLLVKDAERSVVLEGVALIVPEDENVIEIVDERLDENSVLAESVRDSLLVGVAD